MTEVLRDLSRKMDEVIGRQERTLGLLSVQGGAPPPAQVAGGGAVVQQYASITRQEVEALLQNQNSLITTVREIRVIAGEINSRADTILRNQAQQPTAQIQGTGYDVQSLFTEMRDGMNQVKQGVAAVGQRLSAPPNAQPLNGSCPTQNCIGLTAFLIVTAVNLALMLAYSLYK